MKQLKELTCRTVHDIRAAFPPGTVLAIAPGAVTTTFGICDIHQQAGITGGGILGLILLSNFWLGVSSSVLPPLLGTSNYVLGLKYLRKEFLKTSAFTTICMTGFSRLWGLSPPILPSLAECPLTTALVRRRFIGIGCSPVVHQSASCAGDDILALVISKITGCRVSRAYLLADIAVLVFSLSYTSAKCIVYFLITVIVFSFLIDSIQDFGVEKDNEKNKKEYGTVV